MKSRAPAPRRKKSIHSKPKAAPRAVVTTHEPPPPAPEQVAPVLSIQTLAEELILAINRHIELPDIGPLGCAKQLAQLEVDCIGVFAERRATEFANGAAEGAFQRAIQTITQIKMRTKPLPKSAATRKR